LNLASKDAGHVELRQILLEALDRLSVPAAYGELAAYARVFHDTDVTPERLAALQREERRAYRAGAKRQVWICPAIVWLPPDFPPDKSLLTRSDWPLDLRLQLDESGAVRQVWLIRELSGLVLAAFRRANVELLMEEVTRRAELLLPAGIIEGRLHSLDREGSEQAADVGGWDAETREAWNRFAVLREVAEDAFRALYEADLQARSRVAEELAQASAEVQLFGGSPEV
jgi:hypothetical protein